MTIKKRSSTTDTTQPAIYLRVSTAEQADSGLGLAAQETRCRAMCDAKGWPDAVIFKDEGISGTLGRDKRPGLDMMLRAIEAHHINAVVVLDLSRLGRKVNLVIEIIELLESHGAVFVSCKESFDTTTAMGKAMLNLVAVFGQLERDLISERTVAALDERGKRHGYKSGRLPLGYYRAGESILIENSPAEAVRAVFRHRSTGASMRDVAEIMNARPYVAGVPARWYASTVKTILDHESVYRGERDYWPSILG